MKKLILFISILSLFSCDNSENEEELMEEISQAIDEEIMGENSQAIYEMSEENLETEDVVPQSYSELFYPDNDSLLSYFEDITYLDATVLYTSSGDKISLYMSEAILEGKTGSLPIFEIELHDINSDGVDDSFILYSWFQTSSGTNLISDKALNMSNFLDTNNSRYCEADISGSNTAISKTIYAKEGISKELMDYHLNRFMMDGDDLIAVLAQHGVEVPKPSLYSSYADNLVPLENQVQDVDTQALSNIFSDLLDDDISVELNQNYMALDFVVSDSSPHNIFQSIENGQDSYIHLFFKEKLPSPEASFVSDWNSASFGFNPLITLGQYGQYDELPSNNVYALISPYENEENLIGILDEIKREYLLLEQYLNGHISISDLHSINSDLVFVSDDFLSKLDLRYLIVEEIEADTFLLSPIPNASTHLIATANELVPKIIVKRIDKDFDEVFDSLLFTAYFENNPTKWSFDEALEASYWVDDDFHFSKKISQSNYSDTPAVEKLIYIPDGIDNNALTWYLSRIVHESKFLAALCFSDYEYLSEPYLMGSCVPTGNVDSYSSYLLSFNENNIDPLVPSLAEVLDSKLQTSKLNNNFLLETDKYPNLTIEIEQNGDILSNLLFRKPYPDLDIPKDKLEDWNRGLFSNFMMSTMNKHPQSGNIPQLEYTLPLVHNENEINNLVKEFLREMEFVESTFSIFHKDSE